MFLCVAMRLRRASERLAAFTMAVPAKKLFQTIFFRLERKFGDFGVAFSANPISLKLRAVSRLINIHRIYDLFIVLLTFRRTERAVLGRQRRNALLLLHHYASWNL